ncbi:MAG: hypothetical protein K2K39_03335 [Clostridia bacterium]|nr:hypothetical protein [Clostridia bacterium]
MIKVISVKFKSGGKPYYFAPGDGTYEKGMGVIVETAKGAEYATVVSPECEVDESKIVTPLKPVMRIATEKDEEQVRRNKECRRDAIKTAQEKVNARGLEMKVVECEFAFDGSKVVFYFTAESRVDFRELIKDLSSAFHMRIELRQINIRDEIKITGGLAPCGRECCCTGCMSEPKKVSVKMAKNQGLSLNPSKISGLCGRLMCCLSYENDYYAEACKKVPKIGSEVDTPDGKGIAVNVNMLKMLVKVKIEQNDSVSFHEYPVDEIRFMRGNVVMGKEDLGEESDDEAEEIVAEEPKPQPKPEPAREFRREHGKGERDNGERRGDRQDRRNQNAGKHGGEERGNGNRDRDENRGNGQNNGNNRNRNNKNRGDRGERQNGGERKNAPQGGNQNQNRPNPNANQNPNQNSNQGERKNPNQGGNGRNRRRNRHGGGNPQQPKPEN